MIATRGVSNFLLKKKAILKRKRTPNKKFNADLIVFQDHEPVGFRSLQKKKLAPYKKNLLGDIMMNEEAKKEEEKEYSDEERIQF